MKLSVSKTARMGLIAAGAGFAVLSWASPGAKGLDQIAAMKAGGFLENKGQWDSRALFYMGTPGQDVWISRDGITLDLFKTVRGTGAAADEGTRRGHVVKFEFAGASASATPVGANQRPVRIDFMKGRGASEFVTSRQFGEAYISDLYRGVHLRNYKDGSDFRYDLVVMPGADASQIRFSVKGANSVQADGSTGGIIINTSMGPVKQSAPFVYQQVGAERVAVPASFSLRNGEVSFSLGKFNKNLPLVIDPLVYGSYLGANLGADFAYGGYSDSRGNLYMTGRTQSTAFPILNGPYSVSLQGASDAYMVRMDGDAYALDYAAYIGGSLADTGLGVKLAESAGVLWMGGETTSTDFPGTTGIGADGRKWWYMRWTVGSDGTLTPNFAFYETRIPTPNAFGPGAWIESTTFYRNRTTGTHWADMAVSPAGELYVGGTSTAVAADPTFVPYIAGSTQGGSDGFLLKYAPDGTFITARKIGGPGNDILGRFEATPGGGVVVTGSVLSPGSQDTSTVAVDAAQFATTSNVNWQNARLKRNQDAFIVGFWPNMSVWYSGLIGGAANDRGIAVAVDNASNAYVLGQTSSFDFPRTRGSFDEVFSSEGVTNPANPLFDVAGEATVTKITSARFLGYSTGLRHTETVVPTVIRVDSRGVVAVGGIVGHRYPGGLPPQPTIPGSVPTSPDAVDAAYVGGNESVNPANNYASTPPNPPAPTAVISSMEGFVQFLNNSGTNMLYGSYIGDTSDDYVTDIHMDAVGSTWVLGNSIVSSQFSGAPKGPSGVGPHVTGNAFKLATDGADGWAVKLRVGLPVMQSLNLSSSAVAGGLGAFTTATVTLRNPAPQGGVVMTASLSDPTITSFSAAGGQATRSVLIPAGQSAVSFPVFTSPVTVASPSDVRITLDNDFLLARVTVNPWLDDFTVTPSSMVGGNQVSVIVRLFQNATQDVRVQLASSSSLVTLPANSEVIVPAGTNTATVAMNTAGVEGPTLLPIDGTLLGVTRSGSTVLDRATMTAATFSPGRVLSGEPSTLTILFNGRVGVERSINLTHTGGISGLLVGGNPLPQTVTIPAQASQLVLPVTAPSVVSPSSTTLTATEGLQTASGTLFVDDIDIARVDIVPGVDVLGGTVLTGTVTLTRPAGQQNLVFNISSNNDTAGTLASGSGTVTVPIGSQTSNTFTFNTNIVNAVQNVTISVSRAGFTTRNVPIIVRPITVTIDVDPNAVLGGAGASATVSISTPAPAGGLVVDLSTDDPAATITPSQVTIPAGRTTPLAVDTISITTLAVPDDVLVTVTASLGIFSTDTDTLLVRAPGVTNLVINPNEIAGGGTATATVTIEGPAPADFELAVASDATQASVPTTITIPEGATTATFPITTSIVAADVTATISVTGSSTVASAELSIVAPSVARITFSPNIVRGGSGTTMTITLNRAAPAGGAVLTLASDQTTLARPTVTTVTVPAGSLSVSVPVTTSRVARRATVGFTATVNSTGRTARGFLGINP
jgi:hypothetical protein